MSKYIKDTDVYKLVEPSGTARVHCSQIDELPRADVAEVRHARWVEESSLYVHCSICRTREYPREHNFRSKYCPNCGAKMDGERGEK